MFKFNPGDRVKVTKNVDEPPLRLPLGAHGFVKDILPQVDGTDYMLDGYPDLLFHECELRRIDPALDELERGIEKTRVFQAEYAEA